jgi:hypothetical protein
VSLALYAAANVLAALRNAQRVTLHWPSEHWWATIACAWMALQKTVPKQRHNYLVYLQNQHY